MLLSSLLGPEIVAPSGFDGIEITEITADSRNAGPGALFAALPGARTDGARFVTDAVAAGASAILMGLDAPAPPTGAVPVLRAADPRLALAKIAARFYPGQPAVAVAVTGTSGKTSVAEFTRQIFASLGRRAASLGTIGLVKPGDASYGALTTPDPITLHATLADLAAEGVTHLAFEASSHGLDQRRLDGVRLTAGAFTNLGRDHLDYHLDEEAYFSAKLRLFRELLEPGQTAVINLHGARSGDVLAAARKRGLALLTIGETGDTLCLESLRREGFAQRIGVRHDGGTYDIRLPLIGRYQASNALVAAGLAIAAGEPAGRVLPALEGLKGVKGRLDIVGEARDGLAVVDYAHKPEALAAVLDALRPFATSKLVCVFGCGGDRDRGKRPIMGAIAAEKADVVIVTDDNPRSEQPGSIRAEILAGAPGAREIAGRAEAIAAAIAMLGPGAVVVVAGKGHETGQIVGKTVFPFSDHDEVRKALDTLT